MVILVHEIMNSLTLIVSDFHLKLVMGRLIGIGIEHLQNRAFDRESKSHWKKLTLKFDSNILILSLI